MKSLDANGSPALMFESVDAFLSGRQVLEDISFTVPQGIFAGVIGPNGAGKTTLLRLALGLLRPHRGRVRVFGFDSRTGQSRRLLGYLPQRQGFDRLFPASVRDVVMMGRTARIGLFRFPARADRVAVERALDQVSMPSGLRDRAVGELSGGQQQLAFLARALSGGPQLLLLDEPTSGLDPAVTESFYALLLELRRSLGLTIVAVSHDLTGIATHADELVCINRTIHAHGRPPEVLTGNHVQQAYRCELDLVFGLAGRAAGANGGGHSRG